MPANGRRDLIRRLKVKYDDRFVVPRLAGTSNKHVVHRTSKGFKFSEPTGSD